MPTSEALETNLLPAPIYANIGGQVVRLERDGVTQNVLTNEPHEGDALAITEIAVSPKDNSLAYMVQKPGGGTALIGTDAEGKQRHVLFDRKNAVASNPRFSPDGATIAIAFSEFTADGSTSGGGLLLIPAAGGEPKLLQANGTMPATPDKIDPEAVGYSPLAFSPDGGKLLVSRYSLQVEECGLAIISLAGGQPVRIQAPSPELRPRCGPVFWGEDSNTIYTAFSPKDGVYAATAGLWKVDVTSGAAKELVPTKDNDGMVVVRDPVYTQPGTINALIGHAATLPQVGDEVDIPYQFARIDAASGAWKPLRTETYTDIQDINWAANGSGAVVQTMADQGRSKLTWFPADGSPAKPFAQDLDLNSFTWGKP